MDFHWLFIKRASKEWIVWIFITSSRFEKWLQKSDPSLRQIQHKLCNVEHYTNRLLQIHLSKKMVIINEANEHKLQWKVLIDIEEYWWSMSKCVIMHSSLIEDYLQWFHDRGESLLLHEISLMNTFSTNEWHLHSSISINNSPRNLSSFTLFH